MDDDYQKIIEELKLKIHKLVDLYQNSEQEKIQLQEENTKLNNKLKQKDAEFSNLKEKYSRIELAKSIASSDSTHDAKIKINRIVREIDNCIALLNK
jgi:predicted nuclease with TOPRIM domain